MKRMTTLLLATLTCGILFGCAQSSDEGSSKPTAATASQSASTPAEEASAPADASEPAGNAAKKAADTPTESTTPVNEAGSGSSTRTSADPTVYEDDKDEEDQ